MVLVPAWVLILATVPTVRVPPGSRPMKRFRGFTVAITRYPPGGGIHDVSTLTCTDRTASNGEPHDLQPKPRWTEGIGRVGRGCISCSRTGVQRRLCWS